MATHAILTIDERLKQSIPFDATAETSRLKPGDRRALECCVAAAKIIDSLYFEQVWEGNVDLREQLRRASGVQSEKLYRYFLLHGGPWDRWRANEPFVEGVGPKPLGANFYPSDMSVQEWHDCTKTTDRAQTGLLTSPFTAIRRENGKLVAKPFNEIWRSSLKAASAYLTQAAAVCTDPKLQTFLALRATALLTDDYEESDAAWIEVDESPIEITIGPYEVYEDSLFNLKACYEAAIVIRDQTLSQTARDLSTAVGAFDTKLARRIGYAPHGKKTPMIVGDLYFGAGDISHQGYQAMAYNLPNDEHTKTRHGSKKVFLRNVIHGKFDVFTKPISERIFEPEVLNSLSREAFVVFILGHEIAHGFGPELVEILGENVSVKRSLGNLYSLLEEAKADVLGLVYLKHLARTGVVSERLVRTAALTHIVDMFRTLRFGPHEDHSRGVLLQYNWLCEFGVLSFDVHRNKFSIREEMMDRSIDELADAIMTVQKAGDYECAEQFVARWSSVSEELDAAIKELADLPIDFEPAFAA
jgi:Peptidase family M49